MTRKRFKKLLMSIGYSRNSAEKICNEYHDQGFSYEDAFLMLPEVQDVFKAVEDISEKILHALKYGLSELENAMRDFWEKAKELRNNYDS